MKSRHWVTLFVMAVGAAILTGIGLRLRSGEEDGAATGDSEADSVTEAVQSTAAQTAFAAGVAVPVEGAAVQRDTFVVWVEATGRAAPFRSAALNAEVEGPVLEAPVQEGGRVATGQLLARIDPAPYRLGVRRADAEVARAQAEFLNLTLFDDDIAEQTVRDERERQARIRSGLTAAEASLEEAQYQLAKTEILAPFAGFVADLEIVQGSRLRVGDPVATVVDLSRIDVDADVLETELPFIEVGRQARVTFPALPGETFMGRVVTMNPLVEVDTNTARVTVRLANPEARVVPGMHGNVQIAGRLLADRTFVPKDAIVERDRREVVFVFEPSEVDPAAGSAKWRYVTTGIESGRFIEIVESGDTDMVEPGEVVLVDGHATLIHDAFVRVENLDDLEIEP
jgi:RND family efflux transporter MFP subunit